MLIHSLQALLVLAEFGEIELTHVLGEILTKRTNRRVHNILCSDVRESLCRDVLPLTEDDRLSLRTYADLTHVRVRTFSLGLQSKPLTHKHLLGFVDLHECLRGGRRRLYRCNLVLAASHVPYEVLEVQHSHQQIGTLSLGSLSGADRKRYNPR